MTKRNIKQMEKWLSEMKSILKNHNNPPTKSFVKAIKLLIGNTTKDVIRSRKKLKKTK